MQGGSVDQLRPRTLFAPLSFFFLPWIICHIFFVTKEPMATDIRLCSRCQELDFESLFFVPGDAPELQRAARYAAINIGAESVWWWEHEDAPLGSMASVVRRRGSCDLCSFISGEAGHGLGRRLDNDRENVSNTDGRDTTQASLSSDEDHGDDAETAILDINGQGMF